MAVSHIGFNDSTKHGAQLRSALNNLERGLEGINDVFKAMDLMRDSGAVGAYIVDKFGFPDATVAGQAFDELNSLQAKLNANSSVTDLNAAMLQAFSKFR